MSRFISTVAFAAACAFAVHVNAQETTIKSKTSAEHGKARTVTYTGCINSGASTQTYVLEKSVPVSRTTTETRGTSGLTESVETTYALVPEGQVQLQEHVGQRVEVTGILIPAGKSTTKTKIERDHEKDETSKVKSDSNVPQFRVVSIRPLGEACR